MTDNEKKPYFNRLADVIKSKKTTLLLLAGIAGIALLALSEWLPPKNTDTGQTTITAATYAIYLEERIASIVSNIKGAGACRVMVTLENGIEYIYATEDSIDYNYRQDGEAVDSRENEANKVIVVDDRGLLVTEVMPTVQGIVIVCEGGGDPAVQTSVANAVATVLQISEKRVCVLQQS